MRVVRKNPTYHRGLEKFIINHCPSSLVGVEISHGYGIDYTIRMPGPKHGGFWDRMWDTDRRELVARIYHNRLVLYHPQYYADFEDLVKEYEDHTGQEVTFEHWSET